MTKRTFRRTPFWRASVLAAGLGAWALAAPVLAVAAPRSGAPAVSVAANPGVPRAGLCCDIAAVRSYLETKYGASFVTFEVIRVAEGIVTARFEWHEKWAGGMAILAVDGQGRVRFSYDIPSPPDAPTVCAIRAVRLRQSDRPMVMAVGRTHAGNGMLYMYEVFQGVVRLVIETRAVANWPTARFDQPIADVIISDVDADGCDDMLVTAPMTVEPETNPRRERYLRFFKGTRWGLEEDRARARGTKWFGVD